MAKKLLLYFMLFSTATVTFSQKEIIVNVVNAHSKEGLAFANVLLKKNNEGAATDLQGTARFNLKDSFLKEDSLICSFIGFKDTILLVRLQDADTVLIEIEPNYIVLNEIEVSAKANSSTGEELVKNAIKNIKHNYLAKDVNIEAFYRETMYENEQCVWFIEALNTFHYTKYPQKGFTRKSWKEFWKNDFKDSFQRKGECKKSIFFAHAQYFKYYNTVRDQCKIQTVRQSQNWSQERRDAYILGGPLGISSADKVKYQADFLDPKLIKDYQYDRDGATMIKDELCLIVRFKPKRLFKQVHQPWNQKIQFPLFSGTLYLRQKDFAIVKFECQFAPNNKTDGYRLGEPWGPFPHVLNIEANYHQNTNEKWILKSLITKQLLKPKPGSRWEFDNSFECIRELHFVDLKEGSAQSFAENDPALIKDMRQANLMSLPITYDQKQWETFVNTPKYIPLNKHDLSNIEKEKPLKSQFNKH